jgi:hypothetical protein
MVSQISNGSGEGKAESLLLWRLPKDLSLFISLSVSEGSRTPRFFIAGGGSE